jgi:hypothetical protein
LEGGEILSIFIVEKYAEIRWILTDVGAVICQGGAKGDRRESEDTLF